MENLTTVEEEMKWLVETWKEGKGIRNLNIFLHKIAERLVKLQNSLAIQDVMADITHVSQHINESRLGVATSIMERLNKYRKC